MRVSVELADSASRFCMVSDKVVFYPAQRGGLGITDPLARISTAARRPPDHPRSRPR